MDFLSVLYRLRDELAFLACLIVAVGLMLGGRDSTVEVFLGRTVAYVFHPPRAAASLVEEVRGLRRSHEASEVALARARAELLRGSEIRVQHARLLALLEFCDTSPAPMTAARVIAQEGEPWAGDLSWTVGKGTRQGIDVGMPVITPDGLVGLVAVAHDLSSVVEPLYSRQMAVSAYGLRTRVVGMLRWSGGPWLDLDNVPLHCPIAVGDTIVTSGLGQLYPRGVPVGVVRTVTSRDYDLFLDVELEPAVDFHRLEDVLVVQGDDPGELPAGYVEIDQTLVVP